MSLNITAQQIEGWSDEVISRVLLPVLVRKLIKESLPDTAISEINFPGYENISRHGVDGKLISTTNHPYIPKGKSVWECGTSRDIERKATEDIDNRIDEADTDTVYVCVSSRNWTAKDKWINKNSKKGWKEIKAIDASDLEQWLENCPATCFWLSERMGKGQGSLETPEKVLGDWKKETNPEFSSKILLSNRDHQKNNLASFLKLAVIGSNFVVLADTREEAVMFTCAVMEEIELLDYPSIIIQDEKGVEEVKNWMSVYTKPPIVIAKSKDLAGKITGDLSNKFFLVVAGTRDEFLREQSSGERQVTLPHVINFDLIWPDNHHASNTYYTQTGGSLSTLHRVLNKNPAKREPGWAKITRSNRRFIWLALFGSWDESYEADKKIMTELAELDDYEKWREFTRQLTIDEEPPLEKTTGDNRGYRLFSRSDAFLAVVQKIEGEDIDRFLKIAEIILAEEDPNYRPQNDENSIKYYRKRKYSNFIRSGVIDGLILLNINESMLNCDKITNKITNFYDKIFEPEKSWNFLSDVLPRLAEASPDDFMRKLYETLNDYHEKIEDLFTPRKSFLGDIYYHFGLLRSLELMAWAPDRLEKVLKILCLLQKRYEKLIEGFRNKPSDSLLSILRSWMPQTAATVNERLKALEHLNSEYPEQTLELAMALSDANDRTAVTNYTPHWKDDALNVREIYIDDVDKMVRKSAAIVIDGILNDKLDMEYRTKASIKAMYNFEYWYFEDTQKAKLAILNLPNNNEDINSNLHEHARKILAYEAKIKSTKKQESIHIKEIQDYFCSKDIIKANAYLFSGWPESEELNRMQFESLKDYEKQVEFLRTEALRKIYEEKGVEGILQLVRLAEDPASIAVRLYIDFITGKDFPLEGYLIALLESNIDVGRIKIHIRNIFGWIKETESGVPAAMEVDKVLKIVSNVRDKVEKSNGVDNWLEKEIILFQAVRIDQQQGRDFIDNLPDDLQKRYFSQIRYDRQMEYQVTDTKEGEEKIYPPENEWLVNKYLHYKQPILGWNAFGFRVCEWIPFHLQVELLEAMLIKGKDEGEYNTLPLDKYYIETFFENAAKLNLANEMQDRLAEIEFKFYPMLDSFNIKRTSFIQRKMGRSPEFFLEIIKYIYRTDDGKDDNQIENQNTREYYISAAYRILHKFNLVSSNFLWVSGAGSLDNNLLIEWIEQVQKIAKEANRLKSVNIIVGQGLAFSYDSNGGVQPQHEICKVLERIQNDEVFNGYRTGRINARGIIKGEVDDRGFTTEGLAQAYSKAANTLCDQGFPFVARLMQTLAKRYYHDAETYKADQERQYLSDR